LFRSAADCYSEGYTEPALLDVAEKDRIMKQIRLEKRTSNKNTDGITFVVYVTVDLIITTAGGILYSLNCAKAVALFATVLVVYSK